MLELLRIFRVAGARESASLEPVRIVPSSWTLEDRREFKAIAKRGQDEYCALFTFVALGLQRYLSVRKLTYESPNSNNASS